MAKAGMALIERRSMRIFLAGVSCVGRATIGARLTGCLECRFLDLDVEIGRFFGTSIGRLRNRHPAPHDSRRMAAQALKQVLSRDDGRNCALALPPSGLLGSCWKVIKDTRVLDRITFYDIDSHPVQKNLADLEKRLYLREIERDIAYFSRSFTRAHVSVDITDCNPDEALHKVRDALTPARLDNRSEAPNPAQQDACPDLVCTVES